MPLFPSFILALLRQLFAKRDCIARMYVRPTHTHTHKSGGWREMGLTQFHPPMVKRGESRQMGLRVYALDCRRDFFSATTTAQRYLPNGFGGDQKDFLPLPNSHILTPVSHSPPFHTSISKTRSPPPPGGIRDSPNTLFSQLSHPELRREEENSNPTPSMPLNFVCHILCEERGFPPLSLYFPTCECMCPRNPENKTLTLHSPFSNPPLRFT